MKHAETLIMLMPSPKTLAVGAALIAAPLGLAYVGKKVFERIQFVEKDEQVKRKLICISALNRSHQKPLASGRAEEADVQGGRQRPDRLLPEPLHHAQVQEAQGHQPQRDAM